MSPCGGRSLNGSRRVRRVEYGAERSGVWPEILRQNRLTRLRRRSSGTWPIERHRPGSRQTLALWAIPTELLVRRDELVRAERRHQREVAGQHGRGQDL